MNFFMFLIVIVCLIIGVNKASSQIPQAIHFTVNVTATPLALNTSDLEMVDFAAGQTYTAIPDGAGGGILTPNDGVASIFNMGTCEVFGDVNSQVLVSFILPSRLYPTGGTGAGFITVRYSNTSAAWDANGDGDIYFDPRNPTAMTLDGGGHVVIILGGIFEVGATAGPDTYEGEALVTAQYTGL